jgi:formylglycine-generating enzyme required for sulfatase activity
MADIFISYASEDREAARPLADALAGQGWSVFWDRTIPPGRTWRQVVGAALTEARCVVVMWSEASIHSTWVQEEADDGRERGVLIPILIEPVRPPIGFRSLQAADLSGWEGNAADVGFKVLIGALSDLLEMPGGERAGATLNLPAGEVLDEVAEKAEAAGKDRGAGKPKAVPSEAAVPEVDADPATLPDLAVFRDIDQSWCPEMVVLPAGTFMMGSSEEDEEGFDRERPQHRVTIGARFAVGRYPVTFEEYDRFAEETGSKKPDDRGWGRGRRPVIDVSWEDATAYVKWLSEETGESYRLLSEAEWEYACRAGTETRYCFGDTIKKGQANIDGKVGKTTEVGSYPANYWGLYDTHGNVWEWVEDVWHDNYEGAPDGGSAWTEGGDSGRRVLRGGSWYDFPRNLRSAIRLRFAPGYRNVDDGFRVARTF